MTLEEWKAHESAIVVWLEAHKNEAVTMCHIDYLDSLLIVRREIAKAGG